MSHSLPAAPSPIGAALRFATVLAVGAGLLSSSTLAQASPAPEGFAELAAKVTPSVVTITSTQSASSDPSTEMPEMPFNFPEGSPFEEFFRQFRDQREHEGQARPMTALGSGVIIDPAGYIVTNNHVIDDARKIEVTLEGGEEYPAELIGADPKTDLALLKIEAKAELPAVSFGDSDEVKVGDWVMTVGNPFGLGGTVTTGIVSARSRDINAGPYDDFLQIDASVNHGNSGGPTFSLAGEVIGITTAIASPNGGSVGLGFAIPSNMAKPVIAELREHGKIERGWLGVHIQEVTPEIAAAIGLEEPKGALISQVQPDSPAAKAELRNGDVVLALNGNAIEQMRELPRLVADAPIGETAKLDILRDGERATVEVKIEQLAEEEQVAANDGDGAEPSGDQAETLGLTVARITPDLRERYGLSQEVSGVVIVDVAEDGPAVEQDLRRGDVIVAVGRDNVTSPAEVEELAKEARKSDRGAVLLLINRGGSDRYVALRFA
jgi:serine protease Do